MYQLKNSLAAERLVDDVEHAVEERRNCAEAFEHIHLHGNGTIRIIESGSEILQFSMSLSGIQWKFAGYSTAEAI